jgi:hypothetical protein
MNSGSLGKTLILIGILIVVAGGLIMIVAKIPFLNRLPGDIKIQRGNFTFYFPLTKCIIISVIITIILNIVLKFLIKK